MANSIPTLEEFIGAVPAIAIVPFFFAGSLFPIEAMPTFLTGVAKALPVTHALAVMRYGLVDRHGSGLRDIWGMTNVPTMAALSLGVVALFALAMTAVALRAFQRSVER
jgi:ABC-type multidrug transport system permease subunit